MSGGRRAERGSGKGRTARLVAAVLAALGLWLGSAALAQQSGGQQTGGGREAILLDLRGAIGPATADYVRQGLAEASRRGAAAVILRMDTPGGLDTAMREIIRDILASPVPVIGYVGPGGARAASAGTYILYATHVAAMAPGTNLGAATPVQLGGGRQPLGGSDEGEEGKKDGNKDGGKEQGRAAPRDAHEAKAVNDAVAYIRGLAALRDRDADWAERAVRDAASLPAADALAQNVIDIVADNVGDLLTRANGRSVALAQGRVTLATEGLAVVAFEPNWRVSFLAVITDPNIAYILLLIGVYGLLFEFVSPGAVAPGVVGGIALLIGLFALNLLPVSYAGAGLLLLGMALLVAEAFVPSFGILGIGGIAAFAMGSVLLFDGEVPGFALSWSVVAAATAVSALFLLVAIGAAWRAHKRKAVTGDAAMLGSAGKVVSWAGGHGQVQIHGERWQARAAAPLAPQQRVRVIAREDLTLVVEPEPDGRQPGPPPQT